MSVSVLIPYRSNDRARARAIDWVCYQMRTRFSMWELIVAGDGRTEEWCKADAVRHAVYASHGDILVVHDADVWVEPQKLDGCVALAHEGRWAVPHKTVRRLNEAASQAVYDGAPIGTATGYAEPPYDAMLGGGVVVLTREAYERAPLDRRFVGWGSEDESWGLALSTLVGPVANLGGDLWHLWHPPAPRMWRGIGSIENDRLKMRYHLCSANPQRMVELVAESLVNA